MKGLGQLRKEFLRIARSSDPVGDRMSCCTGMFAGRTAMLLTCGPGLRDLSPSEYLALKDHSIIATVKQAHSYVRNRSDIHFLNSFNLQRYSYNGKTSIVASLTNNIPFLNPAHFVFPHIEYLSLTPAERLAQRLAQTLRFPDFDFKTRIERPWGPGIMYENCLYFLKHLGFSRIIIFGWNLSAPKTKVPSHFYDRPAPYRARLGVLLDKFQRKLARLYPAQASKLRTWTDYVTGNIHNLPVPMPEDEMSVVIEASGPFHDWLFSEGVRIEIFGESRVSESIPRLPSSFADLQSDLCDLP